MNLDINILNEVLLTWNDNQISDDQKSSEIISSNQIKNKLETYAEYDDAYDYWNTCISFVNYLYFNFLPVLKNKFKDVFTDQFDPEYTNQVIKLRPAEEASSYTKSNMKIPSDLFWKINFSDPDITNEDIDNGIDFGDTGDDAYELYASNKIINTLCKILGYTKDINSTTEIKKLAFTHLQITPWAYNYEDQDYWFNSMREDDKEEFIKLLTVKYNCRLGEYIFNELYNFLNNSSEYKILSNFETKIPEINFNQLTGESTSNPKYFIITDKKRKQFTLCFYSDVLEYIDEIYFIDFLYLIQNKD